jgi:uncharacterized protein YaiI (UPF0178 family)
MNKSLTLYIDGDAFPNRLKQILVRVIDRFSLKTIVISNKRIDLGQSLLISYVIVSSGADEADDRIVEMVQDGDVVITGDIPLADRIIAKKAVSINHRGELFDENNIKPCLERRNLMQEMRDSGLVTKGPAPFSDRDAHGFANQMNQFFTKQD